jgi:hypothetical protein
LIGAHAQPRGLKCICIRLFPGEERDRMQRLVFYDYGSNSCPPSADFSFSIRKGNYLEEEIRGRGMYTSNELAAFRSQCIIAGIRDELRKKLPHPFAANEDVHSHRYPLRQKIYNEIEELSSEKPPGMSLSYAPIHTS